VAVPLEPGPTFQPLRALGLLARGPRKDQDGMPRLGTWPALSHPILHPGPWQNLQSWSVFATVQAPGSPPRRHITRTRSKSCELSIALSPEVRLLDFLSVRTRAIQGYQYRTRQTGLEVGLAQPSRRRAFQEGKAGNVKRLSAAPPSGLTHTSFELPEYTVLPPRLLPP
jgi:hypothetical protein